MATSFDPNRTWIAKRGQGQAYKWITEHMNHPDGECLIWPFSTHPTGYGAFSYLGKQMYAHRFMCELVNGPAPGPTYEAAHTCGRGKLGCVHPEHLKWKTPTQNALDSAGHGTQSRSRWGSEGKLSRRQVAEIWALKGQETQAVTAAKFDISASTVRDIYLGRSHLGMTAVAMLRLLSEEDLSGFKNYSSGLWSRRNLEAMIDDLVVLTNDDQRRS